MTQTIATSIVAFVSSGQQSGQCRSKIMVQRDLDQNWFQRSETDLKD